MEINKEKREVKRKKTNSSSGEGDEVYLDRCESSRPEFGASV